MAMPEPIVIEAEDPDWAAAKFIEAADMPDDPGDGDGVDLENGGKSETQLIREMLQENRKEWVAQLRYKKVDARAREHARQRFFSGRSKVSNVQRMKDPRTGAPIDPAKAAENQVKVELANIYYDIEILEAQIAAADEELADLEDGL